MERIKTIQDRIYDIEQLIKTLTVGPNKYQWMFYIESLQKEQQSLVNELETLIAYADEDSVPEVEPLVKVIAICGFRKSGKGTVADIISEFQPQFKVVNFADVLKHLFAQENNIDPSVLYDPQDKEQYRQDLIRYADMMRVNDPYVFAKSLFEMNQNEPIVIGDLRFIEELELVLKNQGKIIHVASDTRLRRSRGWKYTLGIDDHLSETELGGLSSWTVHSLGGYQIYNNGSIERLRQDVARVLLEILG